MGKIKQYMLAFKKFWKRKHMNQILILLFSILVLAFIGFFAYFASNANVEDLKKGLSQSTVIYDKDGDEASKVTANRTEGVDINNIPDRMKDAVVAIEDHRFYEHGGFDLKGMARAFVSNLFAGHVVAGGSTITQQLTKNALLSPERTYKRKIQELFLAAEIEKQYSKDEILQMYLNQIYFGHGAWGVQNASHKYFGKDVKDVSISEAAMLAGLIRAPSALNPYEHYDKAIQRRNVVLGQMKKYKMISSAEYKEAKSEKITLEDKGGDPLKNKYPSYVDAVLNEAINKYGLSQDDILTKGYKIYTTMDQNIQASLEKVYQRDSLFPQGKPDQMVQSSAILIDPTTGGIRGLVGGRGDHTFRGFNRATSLARQPGSIMKPLAVYTPAVQEGYTAMSPLKDEKMEFNGGYSPSNYNDKYLGEVPMYKALEESINVPAVWLLNEIGIQKGMDSVKKFGIPLTKDDRQLGLALGNIHKGVSPQEMAEAFSAFPNDGKREDSHIITKIVGPTGDVIMKWKKKETDVMSKKVADQMTSMMLNVVETGTGSKAQIPGHPIAGKTGSTQVSGTRNGTMDQWFVGYTPNLVGAVWMGYDHTDKNHYLTGLSENGVVPVFKAVMESAIPHVETKDFDVKSVNYSLEQERKKKEAEQKQSIEGKLKEKTKEWKKQLDEAKKRWKDLLKGHGHGKGNKH
ncbi:transglycosylase domain-containing protein [Falsibacillus albus]|uniref:PBP1A family penicillin-binding protein n=1 Tax=Falsibacillus albus TaxID=2478915 RepID=A0A3L7K2T6_9BACI|nr:penicillin-binding protein 1A [Falsibacillus albus]RLQ97343.1 PBP1A family penicillin-binding protein [Falsibacillus albus]